LYTRFKPEIVENIYALREKVREKAMAIKTSDQHALRMIRHVVKIAEDAADMNHLALIINVH
jgi:hypothetical protein